MLRFGGMAPIGLLLTAVGALKFGFLNHRRPLWAADEKWKLGDVWATFRQCLAPWLQKNLASLSTVYHNVYRFV